MRVVEHYSQLRIALFVIVVLFFFVGYIVYLLATLAYALFPEIESSRAIVIASNRAVTSRWEDDLEDEVEPWHAAMNGWMVDWEADAI